MTVDAALAFFGPILFIGLDGLTGIQPFYSVSFKLFLCGLIVPCDAVASNTKEENDHALSQMAKILKADTRPTADMGVEVFARNTTTESPPRPRAEDRRE